MIQTFFSAVFLSSTINKLCPKLNYITIFCCHLEFDSIEALTASFADAKKLPVLHACGKNMLLVQSKAQAMIATWCYQPDLEKPCSFSYLSRQRYVTFLTSSQESYHYIEWVRLISSAQLFYGDSKKRMIHVSPFLFCFLSMDYIIHLKESPPKNSEKTRFCTQWIALSGFLQLLWGNIPT